jgi:hypothetical protein
MKHHAQLRLSFGLTLVPQCRGWGGTAVECLQGLVSIKHGFVASGHLSRGKQGWEVGVRVASVLGSGVAS